MRPYRVRPYLILCLLVFIYFACRQDTDDPSSENPTQSGASVRGAVLVTDEIKLDFSKHKVTFIELGADKCIPCRQMQPIMKEIAVEYPDQVLVVFYDVWKNPAPAEYYKIQLIPTQVFIDKRGNELFRHVGFFPKEEILKFLRGHGVK